MVVKSFQEVELVELSLPLAMTIDTLFWSRFKMLMNPFQEEERLDLSLPFGMT